MIATSNTDRRRLVLLDEQVLTLARRAIAIERHDDHPMDIEWTKDGPDGQFHIVQARPETVHAVKDRTRF